MYLIVSFLIAATLAIPTFGISLLVLFLAKRSFDKVAISTILNNAVASIETGNNKELFHVNRAAIHNLFDKYCIHTEEVRNYGGSSIYWGVFSHPMIADGNGFSIKVVYIPRGHVFVQAALGIDDEVLSDHAYELFN